MNQNLPISIIGFSFYLPCIDVAGPVWEGFSSGSTTGFCWSPPKRVPATGFIDGASGFPALWSGLVEEEPRKRGSEQLLLSPVVFAPTVSSRVRLLLSSASYKTKRHRPRGKRRRACTQIARAIECELSCRDVVLVANRRTFIYTG